MTFLHQFAANHLYLSLIAIFITITMLFLLLAFFKTKKQTPLQQPSQPHSSIVITSQDIKAIAGENIMSTQLDLARAYIEMDKKSLAKKILNHVIEHGEPSQQQEAKELVGAL